jgi:predicted metalloprotease with PDZ domain
MRIIKRLLLLPLALGCSRVSRPELPEASPPTPWSYEVTAGTAARELAVVATFPPGTAAELSVDDGAEPYVRDVVLDDGRAPLLEARGTSWLAPACSGGCRIRYRFLLEDAARAIGDPEVAADYGGAFVAPPSTWLLRPMEASTGISFRFRVHVPPGTRFVTGVFPAPGVPATWEGDAGDLPAASYSAFGPLRETVVGAVGARIELAFAPGKLELSDAPYVEWVKASARTVAAYFGRFPVERVVVMILPTDHEGFGYARALGNGGASIVAPVGKRTRERALREDWVMVHEMLHLGFPNLPRAYLWLAEGIATYVEPIARARAGTLDPDEVWAGLVRGLPNGLPGPGDGGLDVTHTWGRTYWGGALFCLIADLEIRERTENHRSLDDALRGILMKGGTIARRWELDQVLRAGDEATGVSVLTELHRQLGNSSGHIDLGNIWKRLGVQATPSGMRYNEQAPLASLRRAITSPAR